MQRLSGLKTLPPLTTTAVQEKVLQQRIHIQYLKDQILLSVAGSLFLPVKLTDLGLLHIIFKIEMNRGFLAPTGNVLCVLWAFVIICPYSSPLYGLTLVHSYSQCNVFYKFYWHAISSLLGKSQDSLSVWTNSDPQSIIPASLQVSTFLAVITFSFFPGQTTGTAN